MELPISLAEYLNYPEPRLVHKYDSRPMYPTDQTRRIVQGIVTSVVNLIAAASTGKQQQRGYLKNPKNYVLSEIVYHPYANVVRDFALSSSNRKIIEDAGAAYPYCIKVTLLEQEDKEEENFSSDDDDDDMKALEYIIFEVLLKVEEKECIAHEWQSYRDLFSKGRSCYNLGLISSYPCLWDSKKRLDFYETLDRWCHDSHAARPVIEALAPMPIFETIWMSKMQTHYFLKNFVEDITDDDHKDVRKLVRVFTNLARHSYESCLPHSRFRDNEYLDYILRRLYPRLLEDFYEQTLGIGLLYQY